MLATPIVSAQITPGARSNDRAWTTITDEQLTTQRAIGTEERVWPTRSHPVSLDHLAMADALADAPLEFTEEASRPGAPARITLPLPDGGFAEFDVVESPVYEPELFEKMEALGFPQRTYTLRGVDDPWLRGRMDFGGPAGFFAVVRGAEGGSFYVDPKWMGDDTLHVSYWRRDYPRQNGQEDWQCLTDDPGMSIDEMKMLGDMFLPEETERGGFNLATYRFACAGTWEYVSFHGGTKAAGQAAITTMTNRINDVYESDFAVRLLLVANNIDIVYDTSSDPYTGSSVGAMHSELVSDLTSKIGNANYDVGHGVTRGDNNGVAGSIGNVCLSSGGAHKAEGSSSLTSPTGDPFAIDYVAHELGHQFGGRHPFAYCSGGPGDSSAVAYEPGSGSTIMAYAGICGSASNLQPNSDAMFHIMNIIQIESYTNSIATCNENVATSNNNAPSFTLDTGFTIPAGVPFELTAENVTDADGDTVYIAWEQIDTSGSATAPASLPTASSGPVYRSRLPTTSPTRIFPPIANIRNGSTPPFGDRISTVARTFNFRASARDYNSEGGRVSYADMSFSTVTGSTFAVTSPNGGENVNGPITVTWNAGSTASAPIGATNVDIFLSTDGGFTYPTLVGTFPNTGSASVTLPGVPTSTARIKIKGSGNIFFDISNNNFTIQSSAPFFTEGTGRAVSDDTGNGNDNGAVDPGETSILLTLPVQNLGGAGATGVTATLTSNTGTASVTTGSSNYPDIGTSATQSNTTPFEISVSDAHPCGDPINLSLNVTDGSVSIDIPIELPTGRLEASTVLEEDFETFDSTGWTLGTGWSAKTAGSSDATPHGGTGLMSMESPVGSETVRRLITPTVARPTQMTFWHSYWIEQDTATVAWDGVQLLVSTNGGSSYSVIPTSAFSVGAPTHTVRDGCEPSEVTPGSAAWSGGSGSLGTMSEVTVDLSAYSTSENVRIAFQYYEDCSFVESGQGWALDDIQIIAETAVCDPPETAINQLPVVAITTPSGPDTIPYNYSGTYTFEGTSSDPDGTVTNLQWRRAGGAYMAATPAANWSFNASIFSGENVFEVRVGDDFGDFSDPVSVTVTRQYPSQANIMAYLLGNTNDDTGLDTNRDFSVTVADLIFLVNQVSRHFGVQLDGDSAQQTQSASEVVVEETR